MIEKKYCATCDQVTWHGESALPFLKIMQCLKCKGEENGI